MDLIRNSFALPLVKCLCYNSFWTTKFTDYLQIRSGYIQDVIGKFSVVQKLAMHS